MHKYVFYHSVKCSLQYSSRATSRARVLASLATRVPHAIQTQAPVQVNCGVALDLQKYSSILRVFESSIAKCRTHEQLYSLASVVTARV